MEIDPKLQRIDQKQKSIASEINTLIGDYKALKEENQHRTPKGDAIKLKLTQYQEMLAILDEARRETAIQVSAPATESLSTGAFRHVGSEEIEGFPSPQFGTPLTPETIKKDSQDVAKSLRAKAAESLLVPEEKVDVTSGLPFRDRVIMSIQPTVDEKNKFLLDKYPGSAIRNVDGSDMVFARVGDKYVLADEWGFGPGDLGDAVGGTTKTAANIAGAVFGVAAFRYHPIFASAIGANLSEQTIGGLLDMGGRKAADQPLNIGEIAARRTALGGIGVGVDLVTGRLLAAPIAKRVGAVDEMEWKNGVRKAYDDFNEGIGIPGAIRPPVGVSRGIEKLTYQQYLAGKHPNSTNATFLEHNRKMAQKWMEVSMGEPVEPDDFVRIALDNYAQRYNALIDQVAKSDQKVANVLKGRVEREMRQFVDSDYRTEEIGKILTKRLREAEKAEADLHRVD